MIAAIRALLRNWLQRRRNRQDARVLTVLLVAGEPMPGLALAAAAGFKPGAHHPTLARLEASGLVESAWEDLEAACEDPEGEPPRRRMYRLTEAGRRRARELLAPLPRPRR